MNRGVAPTLQRTFAAMRQAGVTAGPRARISTSSEFGEGILRLHAEISGRAVHLRLSREKLSRPEVACLPVDLR